MAVELDDLKIYPDKKQAKLQIQDQVIVNRERLKEAEGKYYSPLGSDLKPLKLRSDVPTRVEAGGEIYETKNITQYAEGKAKSIGLSKPPAKNLETPDLPGVKMTSDEYRTYNSTGFYEGKFQNPFVLDQAAKLDAESAWPKGKSLEGFIKAMGYGWNTMAKKEAKYVEKLTGLEIHRGHGLSVEEGGSNWWTNVGPQYARAVDPDDVDLKIEGPERQAANLAIGKHSLKGADDLDMAGNYGIDVPKAFNAYLMEGDAGIEDLSRFSVAARSRILHGTERTAEGQVFQEELDLRRSEFDKELSKVNVETPSIKANRAFKVFRRLARASGTSNNPIANLAGDVVGVVMDGAAFAQNPRDPSNLIDLGLSGTQALASIGALGLTFVPIPGARAGAFLLMKAGDKVATVERLYGLGGRDVMGMKKGTFMKLKKKAKL